LIEEKREEDEKYQKFSYKERDFHSNTMKIAIHEEIQGQKHNMSTLTGKISNIYSVKNVTILTSSISSVNMFTSCFYH